MDVMSHWQRLEGRDLLIVVRLAFSYPSEQAAPYTSGLQVKALTSIYVSSYPFIERERRYPTPPSDFP
jgi:hypothetical protein